MSGGPTEERVIWRERFQAEYFDFRDKSLFTRFDGCEFVKCILLIDHGTEQLAFTECVFKDCNIDKLEADLQRGLESRTVRTRSARGRQLLSAKGLVATEPSLPRP